MIRNHEIRKLAGEFFPASDFPLWERRSLRKMLFKEMLAYYDEHKDCTLSEIQEHFQSEDLSSPSDRVPFHRRKIFLLCVFIGLFVLIAACIILYHIAETWEPPTYIIS